MCGCVWVCVGVCVRERERVLQVNVTGATHLMETGVSSKMVVTLS